MKKLFAVALLSLGFASMAQAETKLPQWINDVKLSGYVMTQSGPYRPRRAHPARLVLESAVAVQRQHVHARQLPACRRCVHRVAEI